MAQTDKATNKLSELYIKSEMDRIFVDPAKDLTRSVLEMSWFRNILYYLGEQWLSWFEETQTFGRRYALSGNVPTPVSNIIRDYIRSTKALILNKRYTVRVWPNSAERADVEAADLSQDALRWMDSLDDYAIEDAKEWIAIWMLLTGSGFGRVFADVDDGVYMMNSSGRGVSKGKVACEPLLPFNVIVAPLGTKLEQKAYVGIKSLKPKEWVEDTFHILVEESEGQKRMVEYEHQLMKLVANVSPWKMRGMEVDMDDATDKLVLFRELEYRPTKDFPKGRYVAMAGDAHIVRNEDSMPIPVDKNGLWDYSVVHFQYNFTPGSFWPTSGIDDLISPQNTINEIDQALVINRKSLGRPMVLTPAQLTMRRISAKGQSLLAVEYDGRNAGGGHPQFSSGTPYPEQVLKEREIQRSTAQDAGGDPKNILRGQAPTSGASGVLVDSLKEAAEASHTPDVIRFYRKWAKVQRLRLTVAQHLFTETRTLKIPGEGNQIKIRAFKGADFRSNTDVRLELDTNLSSTQAGRNEIIMKLIQAGFYGDIAMQPKLRRDVGKKMGLGAIPDEENLHQDKAEMENSIFAFGGEEELKYVALPNAPILDPDTGEPIMDDAGQPFALFPKTYDPTFRFDNHAVHAKVLIEFILSKEFPRLSKERQSWARAHLDLHQAAMAAIEEENTAKLAEKAALGITESGGGGAPPAAPTPTVEGPAGMMPERMQMQGQEGGMKEAASNY